jgi:hypothetical protein
MRRALIVLACALPLLLLAAACGDDDDAPATATGPAGSDEGYLKAVCIGTSNFSNALLSKTSAEEIAAVVREFADEMKGLNPPADLAGYNAAFVAYLEAALEEPTSLVTTSPPEPPADARRRLAALELTIPECKDPTFFSREPTP